MMAFLVPLFLPVIVTNCLKSGGFCDENSGFHSPVAVHYDALSGSLLLVLVWDSTFGYTDQGSGLRGWVCFRFRSRPRMAVELHLSVTAVLLILYSSFRSWRRPGRAAAGT